MPLCCAPCCAGPALLLGVVLPKLCPAAGTLCVFDFEPRLFGAEMYACLASFAEIVVREMERDLVGGPPRPLRHPVFLPFCTNNLDLQRSLNLHPACLPAPMLASLTPGWLLQQGRSSTQVV